MTLIQQKLIDAYVIVVMAGRKKIEEVPEDFRSEVEIKVAEKTIEILTKEMSE